MLFGCCTSRHIYNTLHTLLCPVLSALTWAGETTAVVGFHWPGAGKLFWVNAANWGAVDTPLNTGAVKTGVVDRPEEVSLLVVSALIHTVLRRHCNRNLETGRSLPACSLCPHTHNLETSLQQKLRDWKKSPCL